MKKIGIYNDTAIIITADHGIKPSDYAGLEKELRIGMFYKPKDSEQESLKYSKTPVSQSNIPATILKSANLPYEKYGRPLDEIGEDEDIVRYFQTDIYYNSTKPEASWNKSEKDRLLTYEIIGDASDFNNWKLFKDEELKFRYRN